jgi:hypothetical protein
MQRALEKQKKHLVPLLSFCMTTQLHLHIVFVPKAYPFFAADDDCAHAAWSVICQKMHFTEKSKKEEQSGTAE